MGKKVLITGASRGIGYATAKLFAVNGYQVFANYRKTFQPLEDLSEALAKDGYALYPVCADVSQKADVAKMVEETGGVDILVNNAGIAEEKQFIDITEDEWDRMITVNLKSAYLCAQAVIPFMIHNKRGSIVNLSSMWGVTGGSCEVHYSASKAGVIGFTKALAKELAPSGIRVNCVAPGAVETDMVAGLSPDDRRLVKEQTPLGKIGRPEDIAEAVLFLAGNEFITGEVLGVNGGFHM